MDKAGEAQVSGPFVGLAFPVGQGGFSIRLVLEGLR